MNTALPPYRFIALALLGVLSAVPESAAQTMRSTTVTRQRRGEKEMSARIDFGAGTLTLRPGRSSALYSMNLLYDSERFAPVSRFSATGRQLDLGVQNIGNSGLRVSSKRHLQQNAVIELSSQVDLSLDVSSGAVEAGMELGGLRITEARIRMAASKSSIRFSQPNQAVCRSLELNAGAAEFEVFMLGNSGCREIRFEGGVGDVTLDLTGAWPADARLVAKLALGGLTLRLPRELGVALEVDAFLASFDPAGFTRRGGGYLSDGYETRKRHLKVEITSKVGEVKVEWVD